MKRWVLPHDIVCGLSNNCSCPSQCVDYVSASANTYKLPSSSSFNFPVQYFVEVVVLEDYGLGAMDDTGLSSFFRLPNAKGPCFNSLAGL